MSDKRRGKSAKSKGTSSGQRTLVDLFSRTKSLNAVNGTLSNSSSGVNTPTEPPASQTTTSSQADIESTESEPLQKLATVSFPEVEVIEILEDELLPAITPISALSEPSEPPSSPRSSIVEIVDEIWATEADPGSQENAIVVEDSAPTPIRVSGSSIAKTNASKKIHPFFARMAPKPDVEESHKTRGPAKNPAVPLPDAASQHVRGPQTDFSSHKKPLPFPPRSRQPLPTEICDMVLQSLQTDYEAKHSVFPLIPSSLSKEAYQASIPSEHIQGHPAIQNVLSSSSEGSLTAHQLWVDKWHPKQALDVLGNEKNALYLRDWLQALKLKTDFSSVIQTSMKNNPNSTGGIKKGGTKESGRGVKRPRVIRTVSRLRATKKRRIDSEDEDEEEPSDLVFSEALTPDDFASDVEEECQVPIVDMSHLHAPGTQTFDKRVTNTILLVGPHGSGKTASVYACAEELGWEVFEVYPGIGRRNGASIDNLVGEVGKNHIVRNTRPRTNETMTSARNALSVLMSRDKDESADMDDVEGSDSAIETPLTRSETPNETKDENVQQSLILLEEVDILFKEDVNFWPTVSELIRNCKRPVILTCNDITLVPLDNLPVQTTLFYEACPLPVAASYLQALCYREGCQVERESLVSLYELTYEVNSIDLPDAPVISGNGELPEADLRRSIHYLQMWSHNTSRTEDEEDKWEDSQEPLEELMECSYESDGVEGIEQVLVHADLISYADSHLMRKPVNSRWTLGTGVGDEEVGYGCARVEQASEGRTWTVYYDRDEEIASSAIRHSRGMAGVGFARGRGLSAIANDGTSFRPRGLFRARAEHQKRVGQMLRNHFKRAARTGSDLAMHLDYQPLFRQMVAAEDAEEGRRQSSSVRQTRNSSGYSRVYGLTADERCGYLGAGYTRIDLF